MNPRNRLNEIEAKTMRALLRDLARVTEGDLKLLWHDTARAGDRPAYERVIAEMHRRGDRGDETLARRMALDFDEARRVSGGEA